MSASLTTLSSFRSVDSVEVEISPGELIDKITILEIKMECITAIQKRDNIRYELKLLRQSHKEFIPDSVPLERLTIDLKAVNRRLWAIEDEIRQHERDQNFDDRFVSLARSVYKNNDKRSALKAQINGLLGAKMVEEKSYASYEISD
jgi:hypothetical protein